MRIDLLRSIEEANVLNEQVYIEAEIASVPAVVGSSKLEESIGSSIVEQATGREGLEQFGMSARLDECFDFEQIPDELLYGNQQLQLAIAL